MSDRIFYFKECPRCSKGSKYITTTASFIRNLQLKWNTRCKYCKPIADDNLEEFRKSEYVKDCPECDRPIKFKHRSGYLASVRANSPCKSCVQTERSIVQQEELKKFWEPIIGYWPSNHGIFDRIKNHWEKLTAKQQQEILQRTVLQRRYYWDHLKRRNKAEGARKTRATMAERYSGENHWMKRPEVLRKIRKSCEKYRGDNHWFRKGRSL